MKGWDTWLDVPSAQQPVDVAYLKRQPSLVTLALTVVGRYWQGREPQMGQPSSLSECTMYMADRYGVYGVYARVSVQRERCLRTSSASSCTGYQIVNTMAPCVPQPNDRPLPVRSAMRLQRVSYKQRCLSTRKSLPVRYAIHICGARHTGREGCLVCRTSSSSPGATAASQ